MRSQSHRSSLVSGSRIAGTPARWHSAWRTVAASLPPAANSGHTVAIGSSRPMTPGVDELQREQRDERLADRVEVDERVGLPRPRAALRRPSRRRGRRRPRPPTITHTAAPTSPRSAKLPANASRTAPNAASQVPSIGTVTRRVPRAGTAGRRRARCTPPARRRSRALAAARWHRTARCTDAGGGGRTRTPGWPV